MDNYQVYLSQVKQIGLTLYWNEFFEQLAIAFTVIVFFLLGRISHEKKLTQLLQYINDAQTTRKKLTSKLQKDNKLVQSLESKKKIIWILFALLIIVNAALYYFNMKVNIQIIIYTVAPFLVIALIYFLAVRISKWNKNKTEKRLKSISVTAETEIKQILKIFGEGFKNRLKNLYDSDIDAQWAKESKEQCKLYKCYNQKKCFQDLYKLYEEVIDQIKKTNMCDVCLSEQNISVQKLGIAELETQIKNIKRARTGKLNLPQKKQIVNKLLFEYQKMNEKLPHICKKGCCIKQRALIESAKVKFHDRLKKTQAQLASVQKKG